jgi:thiosulfate/3-mercaptopyruvate sulfurtransferase
VSVNRLSTDSDSAEQLRLVFTTLVNVEQLAARLSDPELIVCDCRHDLGDYAHGRRAYESSHIPGARFVHLDEDLSGPKTGLNGRHPLPHPRTFVLRLGALGIDNTKQVVGYDDSGGYYAARLRWMLRWVGHTRAAVLNGGWDAWTSSSLPVTADVPAVQATTFTLSHQPSLCVDAAVVASHLNVRSQSWMHAHRIASAGRTRLWIASAGIYRARRIDSLN